jgi:hypothetical protein
VPCGWRPACRRRKHAGGFRQRASRSADSSQDVRNWPTATNASQRCTRRS